MKNLLLDTHIWLWSELEPERFSRRVASELENPDNELFLSPISIWELLVLQRKNRLVLKENVHKWISRSLRRLSLREAPVTHEVAMEMDRVDLPHRDPADHFLVATARALSLTLVTADERLLKVRDVSLLPNQ